MIAVDTNILVRLLATDDPAQAARAVSLFDGLAAGGDAAWVADTVLVELVWTLARSYGRTREEQALALRALTLHDSVRLESPQAVARALELFEQHGSDFADCLLAAKAGPAGCEALATFDKGMKRLPLVRVI